jgi:DNA (cytosine-5)-methyltransferase 1
MVPHHRTSPVRPRPHPDTPDAFDPAGLRRFLAATDGRPTAVDLFCGAGGLSLGLERAGFNVLVGADSDEWAVKTHDANLPGLGWCGDLSDPSEFLATLEVWGIDKVDLVAGGVPCQPFSRAGSSRIRDLVDTGGRGAHDHRADLWSSFVAVVRALRPQAVLVENVPDLPRWNDGAVLAGLYESLQDLGYHVDARIIDGFRLGVPQHRQRLIIIGLAGGRIPEWPEPLDELVTLRDAIGDLPPIPRAQRAETLSYDPRRMTSSFQELMRRDVADEDIRHIYEHVCRDVRSDDMEAFRLLDEGQTYIDLPERLRRYRSDVFTDKYKRLVWNELCRSITAHIAKDGYWYIHPQQHRTLSIREAARVQSFPDHFRFAGTPTHRYRQIGNAVPVLLGESVGRALLNALERPARNLSDRQGSIREPLLVWHSSADLWSPPWRGTGDAWLVLMGELLLARARPEDADATFARLRAVAPDARTLAECTDGQGLLEAAGVGERASLLVEIATELIRDFDGAVPEHEDDLRLLSGVGDYVQRAVLTFAFGRRQVLVDRTTSRVVGRIARHADTRRYQLRLDLHRLAGAAGPDAEFNRALLDLGRELCRPADPDCESCPLVACCAHGRIVARQLRLDATPDIQVVAA